MYDTSYTDPDPDPPDTGTTSWDHWDHWPGLSRETITRIEFYCDLGHRVTSSRLLLCRHLLRIPRTHRGGDPASPGLH